jgi:GAF domain-containing protein
LSRKEHFKEHFLKTNEAKIALPLVSQGELIGLLILGSRLNGEDYAHEDRTLLNTLAAQVAPALRVAQMVSEQQKQVRERERIEQELRTAQFIQLSLLPKEVRTFQDSRSHPTTSQRERSAAISTISSHLQMVDWVSSSVMLLVKHPQLKH